MKQNVRLEIVIRLAFSVYFCVNMNIDYKVVYTSIARGRGLYIVARYKTILDSTSVGKGKSKSKIRNILLLYF